MWNLFNTKADFSISFKCPLQICIRFSNNVVFKRHQYLFEIVIECLHEKLHLKNAKKTVKFSKFSLLDDSGHSNRMVTKRSNANEKNIHGTLSND